MDALGVSHELLMLTPPEIDFIEGISGAVGGGLVWGGVAGLLGGGFICSIRMHKLSAFPSGSFQAWFPAAICAALVSVILGLLEMHLCNPGHDCPV